MKVSIRSNPFLLSFAAAFVLLVLSSTTISPVQAQYELIQTFPSLTCNGTSLVQQYNMTYSCKPQNCSTNVPPSMGGLSTTTTCTNTAPLSPKVGERMSIRYSDLKCSGNVTLVSIVALDACIPSFNTTFGSYMYKGCNSLVTYSDQNCQNMLNLGSTGSHDCFFGTIIKCTTSAGFMVRNSAAIVISVMIAVMMMIFSM
ncbi:hypothetical protein FDP41_003669 [Naegleria fowleri]|uniref:Uncharacterized protein n=1 Tax=Naegleria fowleri TaxID=5763 RepID=A0A6A5BPR7_NAEFO|nr:uncharacterized protein FDP41_003669 [Naegleria fowleri]KAF0977016.1 hypothetical protein FDP41_003669 [Naegleria fowleri]CAG4712904.1 unnamed protein product [Naegleria fowleri]